MARCSIIVRKIRKHRSKKSEVSITAGVGYALIIIAAVALLAFAGREVDFFKKKFADETCRISVLSNAGLRHSDFSVSGVLFGKGDKEERVSVACKSKKGEIVTYGDVSQSSKAVGGVKYSIMKDLAEKKRNCDYRYGGDVRDLVPFAEETGCSIGICEPLSYDEDIQEKIGDVERYNTFELKTTIPGTDTTYGSLFYGADVAKDVRSQLTFASYLGGDPSFDALDGKIDTTEKYYVSHIVMRYDEKTLKELYKQARELRSNAYLQSIPTESDWNLEKLGEDAGTCATLSAAATALLLTPDITFSKIGFIIVGTATLACTAGNQYWDLENKEKPFVRFTTIIPQDQLKQTGCKPYGLEQEET